MFFKNVNEAPPDPIFGLNQRFSQDTRKEKVYLSVGIYMDENAKAPMMQAVKKAQRAAVEDDLKSCYLPPDGDLAFIHAMAKLVLGNEFWESNQERIYGAQAVGGTSALRIIGEFILRFVGNEIHIPNPSWANHTPVFEKAGLKVATYSYYNRKTHNLDFEALLKDLSALEKKSTVLFHASCHNPTGADLNHEQWKQILDLVVKKDLLPFFDLAYQGLGDGLDEDVYPIRLFAKKGVEMVVTTTASKNFGLYQHRVGSLFVITKEKAERKKIQSQIKKIIRTDYSNPPAHGDQSVTLVLQNTQLKQEWEEELKKMRNRLQKMRMLLVDGLSDKVKEDWAYLKNRKGMFTYCDLTKEQVHRLIDEYGIYLMESGRINVSGLNGMNIDYVIDSIAKVVS